MKHNSSFAAVLWPRLLAVTSLLATPAALSAQVVKKYNVVFIAVDDLRPELNTYGATHISSPNIDALARNGVQFEQAHCQVAVCTPSRTSVLTGYRPDGSGAVKFETKFRETVPNVVTLPQQFKRNGYHVQAFGKVFHHEDPVSWSKPTYNPKNNDYAPGRLATEAADKPDNFYPDGQVADSTLKVLESLKGSTKPFFLAVGFLRPHLPFRAPQKYWDLYPPASIQLTAHPNYPQNAPALARGEESEIRYFPDVPDAGPIGEAEAKQLIRGYYASVSYMDAQVGRVLAKLNELGLRQNTVVVLWSDHGYKLGDLNQWGKFTNFELDTRVPLIIDVPGIMNNQKRNQLVELVDLYPTLCELTGVPKPAHLQGNSFKWLLPAANATAAGKPAAFSQWLRRKDGKEHMGYSMRTQRYRYNRWYLNTDPDKKIVARELYDHDTDPHELVNIASTADPALVQRLDQQLTAALQKQAAQVAGAKSASATTTAGAAATQPLQDAAPFPNPSAGVFSMPLDPEVWSGATVRLTDQLGRLVQEFRYFGDDALELDLAAEKAGSYLLRVQKGKHVLTKHLEKL